MPRSVTDATRFTPTGPDASSAQPRSWARSLLPRPAPAPAPAPAPKAVNVKRETPLEKVARLRAANRLAKTATLTTFDKVVLAGRVWADRAHRFTVYGLMLASVVIATFAITATGDMIVHNRRKRKEYYIAEAISYAKQLEDVMAAEARGVLTDDQLQFLAKEKEIRLAEEDYANRWQVWKQAREWLFKDLREEEVNRVRAMVRTRGTRHLDPATRGGGGGGAGVLHAVQALEDAQRLEAMAGVEERQTQQSARGGLGK
ncbi:MAG: hypothetical protein M1826_001836 [Phylliscum demangeonii]|nr:MAG: hypothetical protein M1826_001836 [Phylliscum demangeonii]